jgi:hypothetical protein
LNVTIRETSSVFYKNKCRGVKEVIMDYIREIIPVSVDDYNKVPYWVRDIIDKEHREKDKLIHIDGWSMRKPDGEMEFETYSLCFAATLTSMRIYKASKWLGKDEPNVNMVWLDTGEINTYLRAMERVNL